MLGGGIGMENIQIVRSADLSLTARTAQEIWNEYFPALIGQDQTDYMVERFQSEEAMKEQEKHEHYRYFHVLQGDALVGYIGLKYEPDRLFLSKLYLRQDARHQGIASKMLAFVFEQAKHNCYDSVYLTCNKHNTHSLDVYAAKGFKTVDAVVSDIGNGYVMDDYILEKTI
jgi:predicted acetyltransferase